MPAPPCDNAAGETHEVELEVPDAPLWVKADPRQLEQGLINLALNARDAMPEGGRLTIRLRELELADEDPDVFVESPGRGGRFACVEMCDNGKGMDPELRQRVFEPFFTTKTRGRGTGLGLSTTYGMVRQHEGFMSVRSDAGFGSTFSIYLPYHEGVVPTPEEKAMPLEGVKARGTVLLAEDSRPVRKATRRMLERLGFSVLEAADGFEALDLAARKEQVIDLLFTDVVMPGMDGKTLADRMCKMYPETKVVFASGYPEDHLQDHGLLGENVALLQKPFNGEQIAQAVQSVLAGS